MDIISLLLKQAIQNNAQKTQTAESGVKSLLANAIKLNAAGGSPTQQQNLDRLNQFNWDEWNKQNQTPTVNSTLARIYQISSQDQTQGDKFAYQFMQLQNDPSSMFYNPYTQPTNPSAQVFAAAGYDVSNINDEWFEQFSFLKDYYQTSGTTNNVKAPTKKSKPEEVLAYHYNQLLAQRDKTNLAEQESKALREELSYWAQQTDRNYSDDEILSRVDWNKYPTLASMRASRDKGTPIELNRAVSGWSDDWMKGVLWAARNDGGSGNDNMNQAYSAMGIGNQWQENEEISRRLNPNDDAFCPYKVGSTMSNERQLFGVSGFDDEWLATGKPGPNASDAENRGYNKVSDAEDFTKTAEDEAAKFKDWFNRQSRRWNDPQKAMEELDRMVERYPSLKKMNDSLKKAGTDGLIDTTRAIDFSLYDYKQLAMEACEKNQNAPTVTSVLKTHDMAVITDQQAAVAEAQDQKVRDLAGTMDESGTPAERNVFSLTPSTMYNLAVEKLKTIEDGFNRIISTAMPLVSAKATSDMIPMYTDVNSNREAKESLAGIDDRLAALNNAYFDKYDDTQKGSLYAISQSEEFMKLLAEDPTNADMLNYIYYEVYPGTEYNEEEAKAAVQTLLEGIPDPNELVKLESQKAEYESIIDRTSGAEQQLNDRLDQMNHLIDLYEKSGIDTTEMRTSLAVSKSMQYFSAYEATKWEPYNTYELMMLGLDSGEGYEAIRADAEQLNTENVTRLEAYQAMKDYLIDNNISVPDDYMNNLNRLIDKLERDKTDYEYFSLMGDADFDKTAARGMKHFDENYDRDRLEAEYHREGYYTIEDSRYYDLLTDDEKKTYYYLYEKGGLEEANKYLNYLSDGTYGVLTTRFTENQKQYAQNEVRGGFFSAAWANMKALISAPLEGINGVAYLLDAAISGKELNPNSPLLTLSAFSNATMAESTQAIKDGLKDSGIGEDSVLGQIALGAYEIFYNRGRSIANGVLTGGITSGITNSIVQELVGASVMALGAGATAAAEAKAKGAQDWQAYLIGAVTTVMEDFTEGITYSNIQDVLHGVKDAAENGVVTGLKDKVVSWLTKEGPQEMFGETLTDIVEGLTDTMVMRGLSDHADRVASFVEKGMTQEEAEQAAFRDEISGILHTALISYLSPGADIPTSTIGETINSYNYVRETTREMQQQGMDTNMLETMRQYRAFRQQQKAEAKDRKENPMKYAPDRVYEEASEQEANAVAPAEQVATEAVAEQAAPEAPQMSEADMALLKNLGMLDASYDADTSSQTASMAATFGGVDGTVEGDMSKAAACAAAELFGMDFNQEYKALLVTDHELGADGEDVKHAVMTASLSQSSEARAVMTSPEYKTMPAAKKVALLKDTIARDNGNQTVMDEITKNTHEYRVAETEKTLIANGQIPSVEAFKQKQATADKAAQALNQAREDLDARQQEQQQKAENMEAVTQEFISNPTDENLNAVDHAVNEKEKADIVAKEYEQHLANTEEANAKAQQDADEAKQQALTDLRQEAERVVADQNAQREERAAQEQALAEQQAKLEEQKRIAHEESDNATTADADTFIEQNYPDATEEEKQQIRQMFDKLRDVSNDVARDETGAMTDEDIVKRNKFVARVSKKFGVRVDIVDTTQGGKVTRQNGYIDFKNNRIVLDSNATMGDAMYFVMGHELMHLAEKSDTYNDLQKTLLRMRYGNNSERLAADIRARKAFYDERLAQMHEQDNSIDATPLTEDQAAQEIVADIMGDMLRGDEELVNRLVAEEPSTARRILDAIKSFIKKAVGMKGAWLSDAQRTVDLFEKALKDVQQNNTENGNVKYSISSAQPLVTNEEGDELASELPGGTVSVNTDTKYSLSSFDEKEQERVRNDLLNLTDANGKKRFTRKQVKQYMDDALGIAARISADRTRLDFEASDNQVFLKPNNDYYFTLDASTLCAKRLLYQGTFDYVQHALPDEVFTPEDLIDLVNIMNDMGYETPCGICYVESRRRWLDTYAQKFLDTLPEEGRPSIDDLTTSDGLENLRHNDPAMYKAFVDAMNKKGTANPKVVQLRTEYRGDIGKLTAKDIQKVKDIGGLRIQSFSDFETPHLLDMVQAVLDMSSKKLTSQAYTKVPNFAWVFGDTGIKINLSLIGKGTGLDENGNLVFDNREGIDFDEAMKLRERYGKNVGTILVGINDDHIVAAMGDPRVDFIIPFHKSGWSDKELKGIPSLNNYKDYTATQNERIIIGQNEDGSYETESFKKHKDRTGESFENFQPVGKNGYWNFKKSGQWNAENYLKMCAEQHRVPKFSQFLVDNGDGSFSLPQGTDKRSTDIREGYWKTLIDFKMYENDSYGRTTEDGTKTKVKGAEQKEVTPDINMPEAYRVLGEYKLGRQMPDQADGTKGKFIPMESNNSVPVAIPAADEYIELIKRRRGMIKPAGPNPDALEADLPDDAGGWINPRASAFGASQAQAVLGNTESTAEDTAATQQNAMAIDASTGETVQRKFSLPSDAPYLSAVNHGDMEEAQKMVDKKAEEAGYIKAGYHGTLNGGFTIFDKAKAGIGGNSGAGFYFSSNADDSAANYSDVEGADNWFKANHLADQILEEFQNSDEETFEYEGYEITEGMPYDEVVEIAKKILKKNPQTYNVYLDPGKAYIRDFNNSTNLLEDAIDNFDESLYNPDDYDSEDDYYDELSMARSDELYQAISDAVYEGIADVESNYEIYSNVDFESIIGKLSEIAMDYEALTWNDLIKVLEDQYIEIGTEDMGESTDGSHEIARAIVEAFGYNSIEDREVSKKFNQLKNMGNAGDTVHYIMFSPEQIKLADPVTYDNSGNVIPLSERFKTDNRDIRYSLPSENLLEQQIRNYLARGGSLAPSQNQEAAPRQRQFGTQTINKQGAMSLDNEVKNYLYNHSDYNPDTNAAQVNRALQWVNEHATEGDPDGYYGAFNEVTSEGYDYRSADGQARMLAVMGMAALKAKTDKNVSLSDQLRLADAYNQQGTEIGRQLQARKIFRMMTPAGRIAYMKSVQDSINDEYAKRGKNTRVKISDETLQEIADADTEEKMAKARKKANQEMANQMPNNWKDKLRGFRMTSMLMNPRTHIRNIIGNAMFIPAVGLKNKLGAVGEIISRQDNRTKTLNPFLSKDARNFARQDAVAMREVLTGEAKYNEETAVEKERKVFGRFFQALSDFNSNALEGEDWFFLKGHYRRALGGWMMANGYTSEQLKSNPSLLEQGRAYAVQEAQKATYRDFSQLAATLNQVSKKGGVAGFLVDAALPFKKTPANILKRGLEYSPVGIAKALSVDAFHLKQYLNYKNGKLDVMPEKAISPAEFIDHLCAGLSGTAVMAIGFLLSGAGVVSAGLDDDDDEFDKERGAQEYAINPGKAANTVLVLFGAPKLFGEDVTFTMDWAAPMSMPFFVGASIREQLEAEGKSFNVEDVFNSLTGIAEPVFNLSMLDGMNSVFRTSQGDDTTEMTQIAAKIVANYMTSYVPSILGAVARTIDDTSRKAFVESGKGGGPLGTFRYSFEQAQNKIPGWNQTNIPVRDAFGNAKTSGVTERILENFLLPGYVENVKEDPVVDELESLYRATNRREMIPKMPSKTITVNGESVPLTAEQYDQMTEERGQTAHQLIGELMDTSFYQSCSPTEQADMIKDIWAYATKSAAYNINNDVEVEGWEINIRPYPVQGIVNREKQRIVDRYKDNCKADAVQAVKDGDDDALWTSIAKIEEVGGKESQIKTAVGNAYKNDYIRAYQRDDRITMDEIENTLMLSGLNFSYNDFDKWITTMGLAIEDTNDEEEGDLNEYIRIIRQHNMFDPRYN